MQELASTDHANWRMASRAISESAIEAAMNFGRCFWAGRGCLAWHLGRRAVTRARRRHRVKLEAYKDIAVIVSPSGAVITVEHCPKPPRHWKPA